MHVIQECSALKEAGAFGYAILYGPMVHFLQPDVGKLWVEWRRVSDD